MFVHFGPAGNPPSFQSRVYKSSLDMPLWLKQLGLDAYEYQCVRGVHIGRETACRLGELARVNNIALSIHAPYYISLGTPDPVLREKTKKHLLDSIRAAYWMGAGVVVFHPGGSGGRNRREVMDMALSLLAEILEEANSRGWNGIKVAPETAGKPSQLGSLEEVLEFCSVGKQVIPAIDFGHLYASSQGKINDKKSFKAVLEKLAALPEEKKLNLHIHFSPVEYTAGGEKKHWTTLDIQFGPEFTPLAELLVENNLSATVICESAGRQAEDALVFKQIYENTIKKYLADSI